MKKIIWVTALLLLIAPISFSQSVIDIETGTGLQLDAGSDICADQIYLNGTVSGTGTICGATPFVLNLSAFIQGFYNPSSNAMIPDTITVYLRNAISPFAKVDSAKSVLDSSGTASLIYFNVTNGTNYYIVITHRNSIETWSSSGFAFASGSLIYDFTSAASSAYGSNQIQVDASPVRYGIYSGDVNQSGDIDLSDIIAVYNDAVSFATGYIVTDVNGDYITDLSDLTIVYNNSNNFISLIRP